MKQGFTELFLKFNNSLGFRGNFHGYPIQLRGDAFYLKVFGGGYGVVRVATSGVAVSDGVEKRGRRARLQAKFRWGGDGWQAKRAVGFP